MFFVTVLKGAVLAGAKISNEGEWASFRERDQVRNVEVFLRGKDAPEEGIRIRGVEMYRGDGRNPHSTMFVTNAGQEDLGNFRQKIETPSTAFIRLASKARRKRSQNGKVMTHCRQATRGMT